MCTYIHKNNMLFFFSPVNVMIVLWWILKFRDFFISFRRTLWMSSMYVTQLFKIHLTFPLPCSKYINV